MPLIRFAQAISKHELKLIASPWSAPAWMKTNNDLKGRGRLIGEPGGKYYKTWANYLVKQAITSLLFIATANRRRVLQVSRRL